MKKEQSSIWPTFLKNWKYYHSPGKPSKDDLKIVERWLRRTDARRILILGSTPQLRDLAAKLKLETVVVDMQLEMLLGMQMYMQRKNPKEVIIRSDWLTVPLPKGYFDAILGDLILENVPHEQKVRLFRNIRDWLKPNGCFITKIFFVPEDYEKNDPRTMINYIATLPRNENRHCELFSHLYFYTYDKQRKTIFTSKVSSMIKKYYKRGKVAKGIDRRAGVLFKKIILLWGDPMTKKWYLPNKKEYLRQLSKFFYIKGYEEPADYLFGTSFPTVVLTKRRN